MVFQVPQYWDRAVDGIQIILCLLILLYLIRSRSKLKSSALEDAFRESGKSFNVQVLSQTIKQQIDQAFDNIAGTMTAERLKLEKLLSLSRQGRESFHIFDSPSPSHLSNSPEISSVSDGMSQLDELHQQVQKLAGKGLNARQISEELKTPLGEVELILSLKTSSSNALQ
jgi:hypothetical protein